MRDRLVLCYHAVSDGAASRQTVTRVALRRQVAGLLERGYVATTFNRAVLDASPARRLAVTFDDAESNVLEHAFPVLGELGVAGTVFVVAGPVGAPGHLGWGDLETLAEAGWEIGSHTVTHARLTELDDAMLAVELRTSRETIEDALGQPCRSIAYPYGDSNQRVRDAAARAGFTAGCTTEGTLRGDVLGWPRVGVDGSDGLVAFRLKTSRIGRALRSTPLGAPLERAGRAFRSR